MKKYRINLSDKCLTLSGTVIKKLNNPNFIKILFNKKDKKIMVMNCDPNIRNAIKVSCKKGYIQLRNKNITNRVVETIGDVGKLKGTYNDNHNLFIFEKEV